jgi:hypothetical protein
MNKKTKTLNSNRIQIQNVLIKDLYVVELLIFYKFIIKMSKKNNHHIKRRLLDYAIRKENEVIQKREIRKRRREIKK